MIWDKLINCQKQIQNVFSVHCHEVSEPGLEYFNRDGWVNRVWANDNIRRAHIDVVDARDSRGLWMMHVCVFPVLNNDAPIYGFDVIAGKNKVTGAFHDFSPSSTADHEMIQGYFESVEHFVPKKQRELPEWARNIFTGKMLAAGNVTDESEIDEIIRIATDNLTTYLSEVGQYTAGTQDPTVIDAQNYYCDNQKLNPHTANVMKSLGLPEEDVEKFCSDMLFPKINLE